ncbi:MAG: serine hydrolase domain-containing protein [Eubacteriales bacterium]|nr:serine hydrolase domain-containing protein [Eubacteriales bacterium]
MDFSGLTELLDSLEERYGIPSLDCVILKNHSEVYRHRKGYADYAKTVPVEKGHLYRLYSATKLTTMAAVLQLVEQGKIKLYEPVAQYLPEFQYMKVAEDYQWNVPVPKLPTAASPCHFAHHPIQIIHLMTMTAGMHYDTSAQELLRIREQRYETATTREVVSEMAKLLLVAEPGTRWMYGFEHDVLAAVVEAVSGMSYGSYLKKYVFEPAGADDTYFHLDEKLKKRVMDLYTIDPDTEKIIRCPENLRELFKISAKYESGGAGLISTVDSYSRIMDSLCNGGIAANGNRILSERSADLLATNYVTGQMLADFHRTGKTKYGYGPGVQVRMEDDGTGREFGWDGAAGAYVLLNPTHHVCVMYAQHVMRFPRVYHEIHPQIRRMAYEGLGLL